MPTTLQQARPALLHPCHNLLRSPSNVTNEICEAPTNIIMVNGENLI